MKIEPDLALQEDSKAHSELSGIPTRNESYSQASNGFRSHPESSAAPLNALSFASLADPALIVCLQVCFKRQTTNVWRCCDDRWRQDELCERHMRGSIKCGGAYHGMLEDVEETNADADADADARDEDDVDNAEPNKVEAEMDANEVGTNEVDAEIDKNTVLG
ncbi:hypothetical protein PIIN_10880 [Serendipita indica DSM 11827]|uniref:Uncharacterized protein n=1 Tax=Serendipita indica (strain DSM 11827) TaxID=1109443 RepID=G4U001_SERID|nr:hypothetical protein PIIN_10880 [Serendipita indica DSM 11827]